MKRGRRENIGRVGGLVLELEMNIFEHQNLPNHSKDDVQTRTG